MARVASLPIEFFELISKAQSNRAEDQRGLLRKEDLVLPEFLRLPLRSPEKASPLSEAGGSARDSSDSPATSSGSAHSPPGPPGTTPPGPRPPGPFCAPLPPAPHAQEGATHIWKRQSPEVEATAIQTVEDDHLAELTLVGEGDIGSPNSTLLPPPPSPQDTPGPPQPGTSTF